MSKFLDILINDSCYHVSGNDFVLYPRAIDSEKIGPCNDQLISSLNHGVGVQQR